MKTERVTKKLGYRRKARRAVRQRGSLYALTAILMIPLLGFIALAIDGFIMMSANMQQNSNAEYAALAGLKELINSRNVDSSRARAAQIAALNHYIGAQNNTPDNGTITYGRWQNNSFVADDATCTGQLPNNTPCIAIRVRLNTQSTNRIKLVFSGVFGLPHVDLASVATAYYDDTRPENKYVLVRN